MRYLSLFSGIEAASVAWQPLGWEAAAFSEIEPYCCSLLNHYYPGVPNLGDITRITDAQVESLGRLDVVIGGFPCQDVSTAGRQKGLRDEEGQLTRSGLFFDAMRVVRAANPDWLIVENVPGLLSSKKGEDFAAVILEITGVPIATPKGGWQKCGVVKSNVPGYRSLAWRILDAQWFGVPQRRRRIFLVGHSDWRCAAAVLFERESLCGNTPPRRATRQGAAGVFATSPDGSGRTADISPTLDARAKEGPRRNQGGVIVNHADVVAYTIQHASIGRKDEADPQGKGWRDDGAAWTLDSRPSADVVVYGLSTFLTPKFGEEISPTLCQPSPTGGGQPMAIGSEVFGVRRLTPVECERLQGFPDNFTLVQHRSKPASDAARYKALGNSFAVPVIRWLGERIEIVEQSMDAEEAA